MENGIRLICSDGVMKNSNTALSDIATETSVRKKSINNTQNTRFNSSTQLNNQSTIPPKKLTPAQIMKIASRILSDLEQLHENNVIDTVTINRMYQTIRKIAGGYSLCTKPDPDPPAAA